MFYYKILNELIFFGDGKTVVYLLPWYLEILVIAVFLFPDRYMHRNREITRIKREEIKRLKDYLTVLQQRLERYCNFYEIMS